MRSSELTPWLIRYAYERGAFPMADEDGTVDWYQPLRRALFPLAGIHISHSLGKVIRSGRFELSFDTSFSAVMTACLRPGDNWIDEEFIRVYGEIHAQGWAHCSECWHEGRLVGGVYGIALGSCFCAESMFHRETDASKVALWALVERCRGLGFSVFDAQIMNPHLRSLGAFEVTHRHYLRLLQDALGRTTEWSRVC